jgi:hypothetical protein
VKIAPLKLIVLAFLAMLALHPVSSEDASALEKYLDWEGLTVIRKK